MRQTVCRIVSAALLIFVSLARLGETGSYTQALIAACGFYVVWWLGALTAIETSKEKSKC